MELHKVYLPDYRSTKQHFLSKSKKEGKVLLQ